MSNIDVPIVDDFANATTPPEKFAAIADSLSAFADTYDNIRMALLNAPAPPPHGQIQALLDKATRIRQLATQANTNAIATAIGAAGDWDRIHTATVQLTNDLKNIVQQQQNFAAAVALGDRVVNGFAAFSTGDVTGIVTALTAS